MRTIDQQIDAAVDDYRSDMGLRPKYDQLLRVVLRNLIDGKYAKDPMPSIMRPRWASNDPVTYRSDDGDSRNCLLWRVVCTSDSHLFNGTLRGPACNSEIAAIEAWNEGMRGTG